MIEAILLDLLTASAPTSITDSVSSRVYVGQLPRETRYPALRIAQISHTSPELRSNATRHPLRDERYQIDVYATTYLSSKRLATAIRDHLDSYQGTHDEETIELIEVVDIRPGHDTGTHDTSIDITIKYRSNP